MKTRTLVLLRHAKSSRDADATDDFDRSLSGRGVRDGTEFAPRLAARLPPPELVLCSPARRTRDTLAFLIPELVDPRRVHYEDALYLASAQTLLERLRATADDVEQLMVVGHNPGLTELVNLLAGAGTSGIDNLPTFGVAVFDLNAPFRRLDTGTARLAELLRPREDPEK